jgi:hypothetical protein
MRQASQQLLILTFTNEARNTQSNNAECAVNKMSKEEQQRQIMDTMLHIPIFFGSK